MLHYFQISQYLCEEVGGGERKSKNLWSGCEILANFSYNFHSELWTFGTLILGSLNKKGPKSGKVTTMGTYFANLKVCD